MSKPVVVISHERSGTHFLINTIRNHFEGYAPGVLNYPMAGPSLPEAALDTSSPSRIRKGHHQSYCFDSALNEFLERNEVFYMVRDCRAVMVSLFHYWSHGNFPVVESFDKLAFLDPTGSDFDRAYTAKNAPTMVDRWGLHLDSWLPHEPRLTVVTYEQLSFCFRETVFRIGCRLGKTPSEPIEKPSMSEESVCPYRGNPFQWQDELTNGLAARIGRMVRRHRRFLVSSSPWPVQ